MCEPSREYAGPVGIVKQSLRPGENRLARLVVVALDPTLGEPTSQNRQGFEQQSPARARRHARGHGGLHSARGPGARRVRGAHARRDASSRHGVATAGGNCIRSGNQGGRAREYSNNNFCDRTQQAFRLEEVSCPNGRQSSKSSDPNLASRSDESPLIANVPFLLKEQALGSLISMST